MFLDFSPFKGIGRMRADLRSVTIFCRSRAFFFLPVALLVVAFSHLRAEGTDYSFFEKNIRPIFARHCYGCHSEKAGKREGGLTLDTPEDWIRGGETGPAIVAGDPQKSLLLEAVRYQSAALQMPPSKPLTTAEIQHIETWIRSGARAPSKTESQTVMNPSDPVEGRKHWAYQPLLTPPIPSSIEDSRERNAIDRWIAHGRAQRGLKTVQRADAITLAKRLSFQLIGLPPSDQELLELAKDPADWDIEQFVDELLASPEFGRRWGRHWLDLARYADSNGLDENFLFREAWRYRNWIIDAINQDMPFDRFLLEQIAGDLLPYDSVHQRDQQRIAAGFLVVGPKVLLGIEPERQQMDIADEQIETIGRAVLGQSLGCARCHDHKFDPFPTKDYYALAGIFTSTQVMEQRYMLGQQRVMERLQGLGETGDNLDESYEQYWRQHPEKKAKRDKIKSALDILSRRNECEIQERLIRDPDLFANDAKIPGLDTDMRFAAQQKWFDELEREVANAPGIPARAMIPTDSSTVKDESIRLAGKFNEHGSVVPRGYLTVLTDQGESLPSNQSGRKELARWLCEPSQPAGWLMARVQVNRVWHHLMGRGIVRTVDDFGRMGEQPSHPELLDHLANDWIRHGMSLKSLVRSIVLSETFALSTESDHDNESIDADNTGLWRAHRRRLEPESLRDAMLDAAGQLHLGWTDSTVHYLGDQATAVGKNLVRRRTDIPFRSIYLPVIRNDLPELFDTFDFANPQSTTGARPITNVPTQSLFMLNDESVMNAAASIARSILDESNDHQRQQLIYRLYWRIVQLPPTEEESRIAGLFLEKFLAKMPGSDRESLESALALAAHALLASSRFQYLD